MLLVVTDTLLKNRTSAIWEQCSWRDENHDWWSLNEGMHTKGKDQACQLLADELLHPHADVSLDSESKAERDDPISMAHSRCAEN